MTRFKVVLFGKEGSGKTQLGRRVALKESYNDRISSTVGVEFLSRKMGENSILYLWDVTGSDMYRKLHRSYYNGAVIGVLCIDLTMKNSKEELDRELQLFRDVCPNTPVILAGTKSDAPDADLEWFKKQSTNTLFSNYILTSAKEKTGIDELYGDIVSYCQGLNESLWNRAVQNLLNRLHKLPADKEQLIKRELDKLASVILAKEHELATVSPIKADVIETFTHNCRDILDGQHPGVFNAVTSVAVAATVTVIAAFIGFGVGFCLGSGMGPGAFITGLMGACSAAIASVAITTATGGVTAYGLFKASKEVNALNDFCAEVQSWNHEIRL